MHVNYSRLKRVPRDITELTLNYIPTVKFRIEVCIRYLYGKLKLRQYLNSDFFANLDCELATVLSSSFLSSFFPLI